MKVALPQSGHALLGSGVTSIDLIELKK